MNSRMYASIGSFDNDILPNICYLCDSYLGLGHEHCPSGLYVINWYTYYQMENPFNQEHHKKEYIGVMVNYGERHEHTPNPGGGGGAD